MEIKQFSEQLKSNLQNINVILNDKQIEMFYTYMQLLLEWNEKMNLTAITDPQDIIIKHFVDSLTIEKYIKKDAKIIDIGTGAGFPGIPLSIARNDLNVTLMDSLNKRITFLDEVIKENNLNNVDTVHSRAEELARNKDFREQFDVVTSRAVASLNVLLEYMLPFTKVEGYCICMKGSNIEEEINNSKKALELLNGKIEKIETLELPGTDYGRNIIIIKKINNISNKYPRKPGTPAKEPIV
ncbi:MAG: 16S rRNA (guanine(527)-N(7))-methyltransferase RsmG [Alphaproteobacteria bacterium]|nr:16S rRNA (guanine(527)-N(7))-methyltransferase RsmG [Alphaproteobacteria bacterium]